MMQRFFTYEATDVRPNQRHSKQLEAENGGDAEEEVFGGGCVISQPVSCMSSRTGKRGPRQDEGTLAVHRYQSTSSSNGFCEA